MAKFNIKDIKKMGKVKISARSCMALAEKLKETRGTDENVEVELYLVPNKENEAPAMAFDFNIEKEAKPEEKSEEVVEETPKEEEPVKKEEVKPEVTKEESPAKNIEVPAPEVATPETPEVVEGERPITQQELREVVTPETPEVPEEKVVPEVVSDVDTKEQEIKDKAAEIDSKVQKNINPEEK